MMLDVGFIGFMLNVIFLNDFVFCDCTNYWSLLVDSLPGVSLGNGLTGSICSNCYYLCLPGLKLG
jgi:hypothetical protein